MMLIHLHLPAIGWWECIYKVVESYGLFTLPNEKTELIFHHWVFVWCTCAHYVRPAFMRVMET